MVNRKTFPLILIHLKILRKELNNNDPNLIRVFKLSQYNGVYIPTYNDNYIYLPRDNKYHYASKMAKKDLPYIIYLFIS